MSKGEKEKVIHSPQNNVMDVELPENKELGDNQTNKNTSEVHQSIKPPDPVPFLSTEEPQAKPEPGPQDSTQQYSHSQRARHQISHYKTMNEGLVAAITASIEEPKENMEESTYEEVADDFDESYELPPDIDLLGYSASNPKTLDKAMHGPNVNEWQEALKYKINQLEKLGMWVVEDLPPGHTSIPCSTITRVK